MNMFRSVILHRAWIPAVVVLTVAAFVPRAMEATGKMSRTSRAVGVSGWVPAGANEFGGTRLRWMKRHAVVQEPVQGRMLLVPLFIGRPATETAPVSIRVTVAGVDTPRIVLHGSGWQTATYDLYLMFGESDWKSLKSVTLSFGFTGLPDDGSLPEVALGDIHWIGPNPHAGDSRLP